MINRETVVKLFNKVNNKRISADSESIIEGFVDLDIFGVTEETLVQAVESGRVKTKEQLVDPDFIKSACMYSSEPVVKPVIEPVVEPTVASAPTSTSGGLGILEQAIIGVVNEESEPLIEQKVDEKFNKWLADNPSKITQTIEFDFPDFGTSTTEVLHENFDEVLAYATVKRPVLLVGPAGTGKNHLCKQLADALGTEFYFANAVKQEHQLLGFTDANGHYHETQFYKAFTNGGVFMLDELDASEPNALVTFNCALANGYCDFPTGKVFAHEDFRIVAAANTYGTGQSYQYVGRNEIDAATRDRFGVVEIDYSPRVEETLTDDSALLDFIRTFRKACAEFGINHVVSYRAIDRCNIMKSALGCVRALKTGLLANLERDDMNMLRNKFADRSDEWSQAFMEIIK